MADALMKTFISNLKTTREKKLLIDVIIDCEDGEIPAHKLVLFNSSPYFASLFTPKQNANQTEFDHCPEVPKVSPEHISCKFPYKAMEIIIDHIYTCTFPTMTDLYELSLQVLNAAFNFELVDLLDYWWKETINKHLVLDTFEDLWKIKVDFDLKSDLLDDFAKKNVAGVSKREKLKDFLPTHLEKLICALKENDCVKDVYDCIMNWRSASDAREEISSEFLEKIGLERLSREDLHGMIEANLKEKEKTIFRVLVDEAVARLITKVEI